MDTLEELRKQIDNIDKSIIESIANRQIISQQIGKLKTLNNLPIFDLKREEWLKDYHANLCHQNKLPNLEIQQIFEIIIDLSRKKQDNKF